MTWRILTGYELLYKWILGPPLDSFAEQLFRRIEESGGDIQPFASVETINRVFLDLSQEVQNSRAVVTQAYKVNQLRQLFSLSPDYQPYPAPIQRISEQDLYLIEIRLASEQDIPLICCNSGEYEQLLEKFGDVEIKILNVTEFFEMCATNLQMREVLSAAQSTQAEETLPVHDAENASLAATDPPTLSSQAAPTNQLIGASSDSTDRDSTDRDSTKHRSQELQAVYSRGWLLPTSHRISSSADAVQMLLFLLSPAILTHLLRDRIDDLTGEASSNSMKLGLGTEEFKQIVNSLLLPLPILLGHASRHQQPESNATLQDETEAQTSLPVSETASDSSIQILGQSQQLPKVDELQSEVFGPDFRPVGSSAASIPLRNNQEKPQQNHFHTIEIVDRHRSKHTAPDSPIHQPKNIFDPGDFTPGSPPNPPQTDPPNSDGPLPLLPAPEQPEPVLPESPDRPAQPDSPTPPIVPTDPQFPNPLPRPPESKQPDRIPAPGFYLDGQRWDQIPELPQRPPDHLTGAESDRDVIEAPDVAEVPEISEAPTEIPGLDRSNVPDLGNSVDTPTDKADGSDFPIQLPANETPAPDDSANPGADDPIGKPTDESANPDRPTPPDLENPIQSPDETPGAPALPVKQQPEGLNNLDGNTILPIKLGCQYVIENFGGVGRGTTPSASVINSVDTLKLTGKGLAAENMLLSQQGSDLVMQFEITNSPQVILKNFVLDQIDNLTTETLASVTIGNILFDGQNEINDSFDVIDSDLDIQQVWRPNTVTFLNALNNHTSGYENSNDVINGLIGNDRLTGLSGDDLLRGGEGNDNLDGGEGNDILQGSAGDDVLKDFAGKNQMIGGSGRDLFLLKPGVGLAVIQDFQFGEDSLQLLPNTSGLLSSQIKGQDTVLLFNNQPFATLLNMQTDISGLLGNS